MQHNRAVERNNFYGSVHINQGDTSNSDHGSDCSRCLVHLRVTDPRHDKARIEQIKGGLLRDSYHWILAHADFQQWRDDENCTLLWIRGDPGKGKTMLLCGIIDELSPATRLKDENADVLLSYFFCQATDSRINSATSVLRGLIYLLVIQQPSLIAHVQKNYKHAGEKLFSGVNAWAALLDIFDNILNDPRLKDTYLVIDALDECIEGLPLLLDMIVQRSSASRVKWIISSRSWPTIAERMDAATQLVMLYLELNPESISAAVGLFIKRKVDQLARTKAYKDETRDTVAHHLTSNANDTFLWVALVCESLEKVKRFKTPKLDMYPPGLDPLYERMMKEIYRMDDVEDVELCKRILACVTGLYRPVTLKELITLVDLPDEIPEEFVKDIIALCGSFLTIPDDTVYFIHQSAQEYISRSAVDEIFPNGVKELHYNIFSQSLMALSEKLCRDIYRLRSPGIHINKIKKPEPDPLAAMHYSCVYWVDHLRDSGQTHSVFSEDGLINQFISQKFLYWLEALSLLRCMSEGVTAMKRLDTLLQESRGFYQLTSLIHDARRFIMYHKFGIENSPLQVYASALLFCPPRSIIRGLFKKEEPKWIVTGPAIEQDWSACLQTLEGHGDSVNSVAFSLDSKLVASASHDRTVRLWAADTGAPLQVLKGHDDSVSSVVFSPDSKLVASASHDCAVRIWAADTGALLQKLERHGSSVSSVTFSPDSKLVASASHDYTVRLWAADTGALLQTLKGHASFTNSVAFSPDSKLMASASDDATIRLWAANTGAPLQKLEGHEDFVKSVAFSPNSKLVASGSYDNTIRLWAADTGAPLRVLKGHHDTVSSVAFSLDSKLLASASHDHTVRLWAAGSGALLQKLEGHGDVVTSVAFSPDSKLVASASHDDTIRLWATNTSAPLQKLKGHGRPVKSVTLSPNSKLVASASGNRTVRLWAADTGAPLQTLKSSGRYVLSVVFSPDSKLLASTSGDGIVQVWATDTGALVQTIKDPGHCVLSVAFSPDSRLVASSSYNGTIRLCATDTGELLHTLTGHHGSILSVVFSSDSKLVASASGDRTVRLWAADTGALLQKLEGHDDFVKLVAFSFDSKLLASASADGTVRVWIVDTGILLQALHIGVVLHKLGFDVTNQYLLTNVGTITIDYLQHSNIKNDGDDLYPSSSTATVRYKPDRHSSGYGFSSDKCWITINEQNMLWLPVIYRPSCSDVSCSTVAIGCSSGRVLTLVMGLDRPEL